MSAKVLMDTGALDASYCDKAFVSKLEKNNFTSLDSQVNLSVCSAFKNLPSIKCFGVCSFNVEIYNENSHKCEVIHLNNVRVIDSPIDIIIGRPDIREYDLLRKCHDQIISDTTIERIEDHEVESDSFEQNDLWLRVNMICAINNYSIEESSGNPNRQVDPQEWHALRQKVMSRTSTIESPETDTNTQDNIDLEEVVAELTSMGIHDLEENESEYTPMLSVVLEDLLCGVSQTKKSQPKITPLSYEVKKGDIIPMEDLIDKVDDGFDPSNMINHPEDDPC